MQQAEPGTEVKEDTRWGLVVIKDLTVNRMHRAIQTKDRTAENPRPVHGAGEEFDGSSAVAGLMSSLTAMLPIRSRAAG